ncbi:TVP38/TMEM64 family protein [Nocardia mexicana]|uniref:TVP38/TMEM64 family protein n=1 Tax=Nocardia mexicana TaxID=279262 RepID=UPI00082E4E71|nr:TVP38/TMEM64 family protein [Nocardia mexicana]
MLGAVILLLAFGVSAVLLPQLGAEQIRDWARTAGPWLPIVFFLAHALATVVVPRVPFTLSAGLLFGTAGGIAIALGATAVSAALGFLLVRTIGRDAVATRLTHPKVLAVDRRLARRGWLAVGSLRLISPIPFWLINFCAGLSSIRPTPYLIATAVGVLPGTIALVVLGDALTGTTDPALLAVSASGIALGIIGLIVDARLRIPGFR